MERYTADLSKPPAAAAASDSVGTSLFEWFFCDTGFYPRPAGTGTAVPRKRYEWGDAVLQHYWYFRHGMAERNFRVRAHGQANVEGPNTHERNLQELIYGNYITQQSNQAEYKRRLSLKQQFEEWRRLYPDAVEPPAYELGLYTKDSKATALRGHGLRFLFAGELSLQKMPKKWAASGVFH